MRHPVRTNLWENKVTSKDPFHIYARYLKIDIRTKKYEILKTFYFDFRFASITINLGPTFLSGALAANSESYLNKPSCPLIQGPFRYCFT